MPSEPADEPGAPPTTAPGTATGDRPPTEVRQPAGDSPVPADDPAARAHPAAGEEPVPADRATTGSGPAPGERAVARGGPPVGRWSPGTLLAGRLAVVAAVAAGVAAALYAYGNRHDYFDLRIYMSAMRWWADGNDLYDYAQPDRVQGALYFTYPPFAALLLRPFAALDVQQTIVLFTVGTVAAVVVTTWWLAAPLAGALRQPRWFVTALAVPLVFLIEPIRETITFGQINMLLIVLVLGDLMFAVPGRRWWGGVGIGLATALKLFPGLFIVYLLVTRRWRAAVVASATAAGATLLAAAVAPRASWQFWTEALWSTDRVGRTDYTGNQSLQGLLSRLSAPELPHRAVWAVLVLLVTAFGLWRAARAARAGDDLGGLVLTGLVAALISPITWPHHVYWFVPAVVVLLCAACDGTRWHDGSEGGELAALRDGGGGQAQEAWGGAGGGPAQAALHGVGGPAQAPLHGGGGPAQAALHGDVERQARGAWGGGLLRRVGLCALAVSVYAVAVFGVVSFIDFGVAATPTDSLDEFLLRNAYVLAALVLLPALPIRRQRLIVEV